MTSLYKIVLKTPLWVTISIEELIFLKNKKEELRVDRTTETGEFVPSSHQWIEPHRQRQRAKELASITEKKPEDKR